MGGDALCRATERRGRILAIQRQLGMNRGQPERLHLSVERVALVQRPAPMVGLPQRRGPWHRQAQLRPRHPGWQGPVSNPPPLPGVIQTGCRRQPHAKRYSPTRWRRFLTVSAYGGIHRLPAQLSGLGEMSRSTLRCRRRAKVPMFFIGFGREPLLLFRYRRGPR